MIVLFPKPPVHRVILSSTARTAVEIQPYPDLTFWAFCLCSIRVCGADWQAGSGSVIGSHKRLFLPSASECFLYEQIYFVALHGWMPHASASLFNHGLLTATLSTVGSWRKYCGQGAKIGSVPVCAPMQYWPNTASINLVDWYQYNGWQDDIYWCQSDIYLFCIG